MQIRLGMLIQKHVRERVHLSVLLVTLAGALSIGACGSKSSSSSTPTGTVDTAKVARSIEESILAQRHLKSTVVCPSAVVAVKGKTFECIATTASIKKPPRAIKTPFVVTIQNNAGGVTYVGK